MINGTEKGDLRDDVYSLSMTFSYIEIEAMILDRLTVLNYKKVLSLSAVQKNPQEICNIGWQIIFVRFINCWF